MYKLNIALGWSVIRMQLVQLYQTDYSSIWEKIKQHNFITSDLIIQYYERKAIEEDLYDEYQQFMSSIMASDVYTEIDDNSNDINKTIKDYFNKSKIVCIIICDSGEFIIPKRCCRYQYTIQTAANDEDGPFAIYSVPANFFVRANTNATPYLKWIQNILRNEKEVNIIDQYVLNETRNYQVLKDQYFERLPAGCKLNIHTISGALYEEKVKEDADERNISLEIYKYYDMHDRYITTSSRIIGITVGCDFMKETENGLVVRKGTRFTLTKKNSRKAYLEEEIMLAGIPSQ